MYYLIRFREHHHGAATEDGNGLFRLTARCGKMQSWYRDTTSDGRRYFVFRNVLRFGRYTEHESAYDTVESCGNTVWSRKRVVSVAGIFGKWCDSRRSRLFAIGIVGCFGNVAELRLAATQPGDVSVRCITSSTVSVLQPFEPGLPTSVSLGYDARFSGLLPKFSIVFANEPELQSGESVVQSDITVVFTDVPVLQSHLAFLFTDVTFVQSDFAVVFADISFLFSHVAVVFPDVSFVQSDVSFLQSDVAVLFADVPVVQPDFAFLFADVSFVQSDFSVVLADVPVLFSYVAFVFSFFTEIHAGVSFVFPYVPVLFAVFAAILTCFAVLFTFVAKIFPDVSFVFAYFPVVCRRESAVLADFPVLFSYISELFAFVAATYARCQHPLLPVFSQLFSDFS